MVHGPDSQVLLHVQQQLEHQQRAAQELDQATKQNIYNGKR